MEIRSHYLQTTQYATGTMSNIGTRSHYYSVNFQGRKVCYLVCCSGNEESSWPSTTKVDRHITDGLTEWELCDTDGVNDLSDLTEEKN